MRLLIRNLPNGMAIGNVFAEAGNDSVTATDGSPLMRKILATVAGALVLVVGTAGAAPAAGGGVHFTSIHYNTGSSLTTNYYLNKEYVTIANGTSHTVRMRRWTLVDERTAANGGNKVFHFPRFRLRPGAVVRVHTGKGARTRHDLYWGLTGYTWDDTGSDTAYLHNAAGTMVDTCTYDSARDPSPAAC